MAPGDTGACQTCRFSLLPGAGALQILPVCVCTGELLEELGFVLIHLYHHLVWCDQLRSDESK